MRICVAGCGAIGSLFAAHLAALGDVEVWVFDVSEAQVRAINDGGLQCSGVAAGRHGIQARAYYRTPLHRQRAMEPYADAGPPLPATDELARTNVALPMSPVLDAAQARDVVAAVAAATAP